MPLFVALGLSSPDLLGRSFYPKVLSNRFSLGATHLSPLYRLWHKPLRPFAVIAREIPQAKKCSLSSYLKDWLTLCLWSPLQSRMIWYPWVPGYVAKSFVVLDSNMYFRLNLFDRLPPVVFSVYCTRRHGLLPQSVSWLYVMLCHLFLKTSNFLTFS